MARAKQVAEKTVKVKAKANIKCDKEVVKIGQEFIVKKSVADIIKDYVEVIGEIEPEAPPVDSPEGDNAEGDGENEEE